MIKCKICGSPRLTPDPADYYGHAHREDGAPLMCLDWNISRDSINAHSTYPADIASQPRDC